MKRFWLLLLVWLMVGCGTTAVATPNPNPTPIPPTATVAEVAPTPAETAVSTTTPLPASLPFDDFLNQSYGDLLRRDPELLTAAGLSDVYGSATDQLTDISPAYIAETQALQIAVRDQLHSYDRANLTPEQQLSYDIYDWYLTDLIAGHAYATNDYPVNFFITSVHQDMLQFFTDIHPITAAQDVADYIARLAQVDDKFDQLITGLQIRQEAGVVLPRFAIQWTLGDIRQMANSAPRRTPFYTTLQDKMALLSSIPPDEQTALLDAAAAEIETAVLPAYAALADTLTQQLAIATDDDGVWKFPNGADYYAYTLRHFSTTDMTATDIHALGLQEVAHIQAEMRLLFDQLGYPADETLPQLMARVVTDSGRVFGDDIVATYEAIINEAKQNVSPAFDIVPQADVIVIGVPYGGYYVSPAVDGSRPGAFYATDQGSEARYGMATLAYHEAVPGHHFQLAIMQELTGLPHFRNGVTFTAYTEGWALYAEQLAYELGFYEDDIYGNIGRLQGELFRAVRLVVDTGIHDQGWTFDEAVDYMMANTGYPRGMVEGQIARYVIWPGQAVAYKIGMMKIVELRQRAQDALGADFDLRAFHNVILQNGSMPLAILEQVVDAYIAAELAPK